MLKVLQEFNMVYLDHASSSKINEKFAEAAKDMLPRFYANPSAQHILGYEIAQLMSKSRQKIAKAFNVLEKEVIFTASGCEALNMAIKGIALAHKQQGNEIISVQTEHQCVLESLTYLKKHHNFVIRYVNVDRYGRIDMQHFTSLLSEKTIMVSMMMVNNEIATIHPINDVAKTIKRHAKKAVFVIDGVAAVGKIDISKLSFDALVFSQHKLGGLSGSGCLIKKQHVAMVPLISGGQQEFNMRAGTPFAIANILFGDVLVDALTMQREKETEITVLSQYLKDELQKRFNVTLISDPLGSPYIVSFLQEKVHSSIILNVLSAQQVYVSSHSACASESKAPSHVLSACGYDDHVAQGMIRVSFHYDTTKEEVDAFLNAYEKVSEYVT